MTPRSSLSYSFLAWLIAAPALHTVAAHAQDAAPAAPTSDAVPALPPPATLPPAPPSAAQTATEYGASAHAHRPGPSEYIPYGTGSRFNVPLEEMPATVNVIDQRDLEERGALSVDQALTLLPGVMPIWEYGGFLHLSVRGFQAITLYDGIRDTRALVADSAPQTGILDLERMEVLRGPSSVLYGYGAVGGVVNLIHKQPSRDARYELDLGMGLPNQHVVHAGAQGPLGELLSYRVDVGQVVHEDFRGARTERNQATASLRFNPTKRNTFELRLSVSRDRYSTDVGIPTVEDPEHPGTWRVPRGTLLSNNYGTANDYIAYQRIDVGASYRYDFTDTTYLQARLNVVDDHYTYLAAESLSYVPAMDMTPAQVDRGYLGFARGWTPVTGQLELHSEQYTGPVQHKLALGYQIDDFGGVSDSFDPTAMPNTLDFAHPVDLTPKLALARTALSRYRHVTNSLYGFDHMHLLDNLILTGGLRGDLVNSHLQRENVDPISGNLVANPDTGFERTGVKDHVEALTGQVGLVYTPVSPLTTYLSYASSFMPLFNSSSDTRPANYKPERGQQVEGGVRLRVEHDQHTLTFDGAAYYIQKSNVLVARNAEDFVQAGKVQSRGFDLAVRYAAPRLFELDASYAYNVATYQDFVTPDPVTGVNVSRKGNQVEFAPRHGVNARMRILFTKQIGIGLGLRAVVKQVADPENRVPLPDYTLLDASAFIRGEHTSFILSASNLLDEHQYFTSAINTGNPGPQLTPGPGREILGTLRFTY